MQIKDLRIQSILRPKRVVLWVLVGGSLSAVAVAGLLAMDEVGRPLADLALKASRLLCHQASMRDQSDQSMDPASMVR